MFIQQSRGLPVCCSVHLFSEVSWSSSSATPECPSISPYLPPTLSQLTLLHILPICPSILSGVLPFFFFFLLLADRSIINMICSLQPPSFLRKITKGSLLFKDIPLAAVDIRNSSVTQPLHFIFCLQNSSINRQILYVHLYFRYCIPGVPKLLQNHRQYNKICKKKKSLKAVHFALASRKLAWEATLVLLAPPGVPIWKLLFYTLLCSQRTQKKNKKKLGISPIYSEYLESQTVTLNTVFFAKTTWEHHRDRLTREASAQRSSTSHF